MRVIAGKFRSRNLKTSDNLRPTTDRTRETLFNILQNDVPGSIFVDAFAGSGSVGIEAISRGAATTYFIESNRKALQILEKNLESLGPASWRILTMDVWKALEILPQQVSGVDLFFFDPPYAFTKYGQLLMAAAVKYPQARFIVEHSSRTLWETPPVLEQTRSIRIGETQLSFFTGVLQEGD
jgi:16S rRNA (guanine966-N2)-methyltransferase